MLFGPILQNLPRPIVFDAGTIDCLKSFKLLGVIITDNLSLENQINTVCATAGSCLYFFQLLKCSSITCDNLPVYIGPVIKYACLVSQSGSMVNGYFSQTFPP
jgi:hypothetical protein